MKKSVLFLLAGFLLPFWVLAQTGIIRGTVKDEAGQIVGFSNVKIQNSSVQTQTDSLGNFELKDVPYGKQVILIGDEKTVNATESVEVKDPVTILKITARNSGYEALSNGFSNDIPTVTLNDDEIKESGSQNVSSVLNASRDAFTSATSFVFSTARFRIRGYEDDNFLTIMNGAVMTDLTNGRAEYGSWSGLNDVMRSRDVSFGLNPSLYSFAGIGGTYNIDSRASHQRKQLQVTYSASNRTFDNRLMLTYGSGINAKGWSYAISYSRRWATEGFIPGTFYDGHSFFASVEKQINASHSLSLTAFGAKTKNGRSAPAVREMFDLAGTNYYNPNWGYQNGKKRNAVVGDVFQPVVILTHDWKINDRSNLETALSYGKGKNKVSGLDWFNAIDPRPDFFRKLPSWDPNYGEDVASHSADSSELAQLLSTNEQLRQINWNALYEANKVSDTAKYVISNRVSDESKFGFNTIYSNIINDHVTVNGGLTYLKQDQDNYRQLEDLLGGKYYVNLNQFAAFGNRGDSAATQNDLNNPNSLIKEGDIYGYRYVAHVQQARVWGQAVLRYERFDYFVAANFTTTSMYRTGKMRNGVFANNSFGDSKKYSFNNPGVKGGITYKYNGRNYFFVNASYLSRAPLIENAFVSLRTRDFVAPDLKSEQIYSAEGGYILRAPRLKAKAVAFVTQFKGITDTRSYFDGDYLTFVNFTLTDIEKRHTGLEIAVDANIGKGFSATAVASVGQFVYTSRPNAQITQDNKDTLLASNQTVYIKNLRVSGGPQSAYTVGLNYRSRRFWFVNVNFNYFDHIYADFSPTRRTLTGLDLVNAGSETWNQILQQETFKGQFTMDVSGGWSWRLNNKFKALKRNSFLVLNLGITNLLDNNNLVTTAFEQLRFDANNKNVNTFPPKYGYAFGTTFFANVTFRFN